MRKCFLLISGLIWMNLSIGQKKELVPVIIIMADQLRTDALGELTPNINAFKKDGVSFSRAYCAAPLCAPSRASFFTGLYPNHTGSMINPFEKDDEVYGNTKAGLPNLYTLMDDQWDSYHVGKQHFFTEDKIDKDPKSKTRWITQENYTAWMKAEKKTKPGGKQFKDNAPELVSGSHTQLRSYSTPAFALYPEGNDFFLDHYIATESIKAIRGRDKSKPLLLNAMFLAPHPPFSIPDPYFSMVKSKDFTLPENIGQWYPGQSPLQMYNLTGFIGSRYNREQWREIWTKYLGLVKLLDDEVGRIIQTLKDEGLYEKSIIVFTADHGEMLGSHSLWQKMCMYEESAKVPLILKLPKGQQGAVKESDALVSLIDVLPTIMDINGIPGLKKMDGHSLLPEIQGIKTNSKSVFIQYDGNGSLGSAQRCLIKGNYKLIVDMFQNEKYLELYDVIADPKESVNLMFDKKYAAVAGELIAELAGTMKKSGDRIALPDGLQEQFGKTYKSGIQKSDKSQ